MKKLEKQTCREKTDEELMVLYQQGEEAAFEVIFERHAGRVLQFLTSKLQNREFAQDIVQQAFLKLHRSREQYSSQFPFLPWLFTIAKTTMMDAMKESTALKRMADNEGHLIQSSTPSNREFIVSDQMNGLPDSQRNALTLRFFQDASFEEIAQKLGTSESNARQLVSRAVRKLKKSFSLKKGGAS